LVGYLKNRRSQSRAFFNYIGSRCFCRVSCCCCIGVFWSTSRNANTRREKFF